MFRIDKTRVNIQHRENESKGQTIISELTVSAETVKNDLTQKTATLPASVSEDLAKNIIDKAQAEAAAIREQAKTERLKAEQLISEAEITAERIIDGAREQGYEEGRLEAQEALDELLEQNRASLERIMTEVAAKSTAIYDSAESDIIELCFAIIRKIANLDRTKDGELFKATIKKTLKTMDVSGGFTIRISQEDFDRFFPDGEYAFDMGDGQITATLLPDENLGGGDIVLDTENESITAGIESQLKCIEIAFNKQLGKKDDEN